MSDNIVYILLSATAVLITLTLHECAHGYMAYKLGDPTARNMGRLTLNPISHIDPIGALCLIFFRFGWAKPVPINPRHFKKPKRDFALTALAGPLSNIIMAFVSAGLYLLLFAALRDVVFSKDFLYQLAKNTLSFIFIFHSVNVGLGVFNLIPVPPLDGSRLLNVILPPKMYFGIMRYERTIYFVLLGWLLLGGYVSSFLLSIPLVASSAPLSFIAELFSLSGILGKLMNLISDLMLSFWQLIPALKL
jgi:Zn-dependent protease